MSQFFGSTQAPAAALRRCAARIDGVYCGEVCDHPFSRFCNNHIPGFTNIQQTYGRCTHFDSTGRICQNPVVTRSNSFCPEHQPSFVPPFSALSFLPTATVAANAALCMHTENGVGCPRIANIRPSTVGHSFVGCNIPMCDAHAWPHMYNYFQGLITSLAPPAQIQQIRAVPVVVSNNHSHSHTSETCSICTESIDSEPCDLRCKHVYHAKCIDQWFTTLRSQSRPPTCPYCRSHVNEDDYRKVRIAALPEPSQDNYDYYGGSDEAIMGRGPGADLFYRGHVAYPPPHEDQDEASEIELEGYNDYFQNLVPRNLVDDFDRVASDDLDASDIAQQHIDEIVGRETN